MTVIRTCYFRADSPRVTGGLLIGRSLDYMIYVEALRRVGKPVAAHVLASLIVRSHTKIIKRVTITKLVGWVHSDYRGSIKYWRNGDIYVCAIRGKRRKLRYARTNTSGESAPMVPPVTADTSATSHRDIEI